MALVDENRVGTPDGAQRGIAALLGVGLVIAGGFALASTLVATVAATLLIALALLVGGVAQLVHAARARGDEPVGHHVLLGVIALLAGLAFLFAPGLAATSLTLVMAVFFVFGGAIRIASAARLRYRGSGVVLGTGILAIAFGVLVILRWPESSLWALGLLLAIDLLVTGVAWLAIAFSSRRPYRPARVGA